MRNAYQKTFMQLEIITPVEKIYSGEVVSIQVPGTRGSFEILRNHAPIISTLEHGKIKIQDSKYNVEFIDIQGGIIEVKSNKIIVLAEV